MMVFIAKADARVAVMMNDIILKVHEFTFIDVYSLIAIIRQLAG
jgi:hypothetical protein